MKTRFLAIGLCLFGLVACTSPKSVAPTLVLATPEQVSYETEVALAKLGQMLSSGEYEQENVAQLYYERGLVFDRAGLRSLARFDFARALQVQPTFAPAYNFMGLYATLESNFDEAYESFDSAIELQPDYAFSYFYRALALYYAEKTELAIKDMEYYYEENPQDPYRVLWRYIVLSQQDSELALSSLRDDLEGRDSNEWAWYLVANYAGQVSDNELLQSALNSEQNNRELAERLCEAYFYMAKSAQQRGDIALARAYYKLSLANNIFDFVEHRFALFELDRI
ncbi:lipoprotein NlpI [Alginatibacterium sediminis]|uniref:Lipoprotein NlpI n=1 Tax=Alginatibacterium sediminis TaxID=2164068 RepID=A0A420E6N0_9ALTE|nr:lipoprotein NlpI [Alginatibacterium sediminis]RKF13643.1 lipoprotein NlpI [Alginatibacterium sediminis]